MVFDCSARDKCQEGRVSTYSSSCRPFRNSQFCGSTLKKKIVNFVGHFGCMFHFIQVIKLSLLICLHSLYKQFGWLNSFAGPYVSSILASSLIQGCASRVIVSQIKKSPIDKQKCIFNNQSLYEKEDILLQPMGYGEKPIDARYRPVHKIYS